MVFDVRVAFPSNATLAAQNLAGTLNSTSDKVLYSVVALNGPVNVSDLSLTAQLLVASAPAPAPGPLAGEDSPQVLLDNHLMPYQRLAASGHVGLLDVLHSLQPWHSTAALLWQQSEDKLQGFRNEDLNCKVAVCRISSRSCPDSTHCKPNNEHFTSRWAISEYHRSAALAAIQDRTASCQGLYQLLLAMVQSLLRAYEQISTA